MDKKLIQEMIDIINKNDLSELEVGADKVKISIKKMPNGINFAELAENGFVKNKKEETPAPKEDKKRENCFTVTSPLAGTFYRSPSPAAPPFVEEGDKVEQGQTLCIVEAMKLMNEISSERSGIIKSIEVKNEETVQPGQILFYIGA